MQPGLPGSTVPPGQDWISRELADLKRQVQQLAAANQLATAGITTTPTGIAISGTLSLPAGIIGNASLANPVDGGYANSAMSSGLTFTTSWADYATGSITVPAGFSQALVLAVSTIGASAGGSYFTMATKVQVGATVGDSIATGIAAASSGSVSAFLATLVTGLSGGTIAVTSEAIIVGSMSSGTGNSRVSAIATFLR